jgi:hypothetical protein
MTVRQALSSNPTNLANLLSNLSHHLFTLLPSPLFPGTANNASPQDATKECLNCLRVLGRIIVVIYESEADARDRGEVVEDTFAWKWLWRRMKVSEVRDRSYEMGEEMEHDEVGAEGEGTDGEAAQFTIADESDASSDEGEGEAEEGARAFKAVVGNPAKAEEEGGVRDPLSQSSAPRTEVEGAGQVEDDSLPCLIDRLFSCTIDLLFCAGFTVPESVKGQSMDGDKINVSHSVRQVGFC